MKHNLKTPCSECPFVGKMPGWIGAHKHPAEFDQLAQRDVAFPCHRTVDYGPGWETRLADAERCAGQLAYMNKCHKLSRDRETVAHQNVIADSIEVLFPAEVLVATHLAFLLFRGRDECGRCEYTVQIGNRRTQSSRANWRRYCRERHALKHARLDLASGTDFIAAANEEDS